MTKMRRRKRATTPSPELAQVQTARILAAWDEDRCRDYRD